MFPMVRDRHVQQVRAALSEVWSSGGRRFATFEDVDDEAHFVQYLDGQLTVERRTIIKTHLDLCGHCGSTYEFEFELRQVVSKRCSDQVPDQLKARIFQAIVEAQRDD